MALTANSLQGFLAVYSQKSLNAFLANMPPRDLFTENFDSDIASAGVSVTTRIPTTVYGTLNDLGTNGWETQQASASAVTITLATKGHDHAFNVTDWATITPQVLENLYLPVLAKQTANGFTVACIQNVTSSVYTTTMNCASSSLSIVGPSSSLAYASTLLTKNEIPTENRYALLSPETYQAAVSGVFQTYVYGNTDVVQGNGFQGLGRGIQLLEFQTHQYARFQGASMPYGGDVVTHTTDKTLGIVGQKQGIVVAARTPIDMQSGLIQSYTAVDPTSKLSLQVILSFDQSKPMWRIGTYVLFGTAAGNTKAIVPILASN